MGMWGCDVSFAARALRWVVLLRSPPAGEVRYASLLMTAGWRKVVRARSCAPRALTSAVACGASYPDPTLASDPAETPI